jgi:hypothetical protein
MAFLPYLASSLLPIVVITGNYLGGIGTVIGIIVMFVFYPAFDIILGSRQGHAGIHLASPCLDANGRSWNSFVAYLPRWSRLDNFCRGIKFWLR